jgi:TonB dependent receptor/Carboxypeptidase regulatory-like domain/TonB-dependent Receptor Plug Domain
LHQRSREGIIVAHRFGTRLVALAVLFGLLWSSTTTVWAQATTSITGVITNSGKPVAQHPVTLTGNNLTLHATSNTQGAFAFNGLTVGTYTVTTPGESGLVSAEVQLTSNGASLTLSTAAIQQIGRISVTRSPVTRASGTDVVLNGTQLRRMPAGGTLPDILTQLPSAARGSNGQIHINGDHNGINYLIDGVQIPEGLNRVLGNEVDPSNIGFSEFLEGAYPAQYGDRFAAVVNIATKSQTGPPGATFDLAGGSYALLDNVVSAHTPVGAGNLFVGSRLSRNDRALDPPVQDFLHDAGSTASQFLRYSTLVHGTDTLSFDLTHSLQTFQIPPDTSSGLPATTDENEVQNDTYASLIYRHAIGDRGVFSIGPSFKRSRLLDTNDPANDLVGQINSPQGGACSSFADCSFLSVFADRTVLDYRMNADYVLRSANHEIRAGAIYGAETLKKNYTITVPATTADGSALTPFTVVDNDPNVRHTEEFYVQDGWQMGESWRLDYGVRADAFQEFSPTYDNGFFQVSPRVKLTRILTPRSSVYAYYGRLFVPFSIESVSPTAALALYGGTASGSVSNDLRPQRDSLYEIGGHLPLGRGDVGIRISHKVSTDWLDDTQVGATNLHQDINFPIGRVDSQNVVYTQPMARNGRFSFSVSHVLALNSTNCETQLLQNCAANGPAGGDLVQADHDQHWDAATGLLFNDQHGGWFSINGEYGSGLSQDPSLCPPFPLGNAINCKVPPHLTFDLEKGVPVAKNTTLALTVRNLFNDRYAITLNNSLQGTHYAAPRTVELRLSTGTGSR